MYSGPKPTDINKSFPDHDYDHIVCLLTGQKLRMIRKDRLKKLGITKEKYLDKFPGAPLMSLAAKKTRSNTISSLNLDESFNEKKSIGRKEMFKTNEGLELRKKISDNAIKQHKETDLEDCIRKYFKTDFKGSIDQKNRSDRMIKFNKFQSQETKDRRIASFLNTIENNTDSLRKKQFKKYNIFYQSSYELLFLNECELLGIIDSVKI